MKVVSSSPGEDTLNNYFHFNCILSPMGLPNNIYYLQAKHDNTLSANTLCTLTEEIVLLQFY